MGNRRRKIILVEEIVIKLVEFGYNHVGEITEMFERNAWTLLFKGAWTTVWK